VRPFVYQVDVGVSNRRYCADTLRGDERELQRNPRGGRHGRTVEVRPKRLELRFIEHHVARRLHWQWLLIPPHGFEDMMSSASVHACCIGSGFAGLWRQFDLKWQLTIRLDFCEALTCINIADRPRCHSAEICGARFELRCGPQAPLCRDTFFTSEETRARSTTKPARCAPRLRPPKPKPFGAPTGSNIASRRFLTCLAISFTSDAVK
jgi:hypothetical protein